MGQPIDKISIHGFLSIERLVHLELRPINVLIGANGAGKSNFVQLFRLIRAMADENLQGLVNKGGGADQFLFLGPNKTREIRCRLVFASASAFYHFELNPTKTNEAVISFEMAHFTGSENPTRSHGGKRESTLKSMKDQDPIWKVAYDAISSWVVYHFHDANEYAPMRREESVEDHAYLRENASNIAPYLHRLRDEHPTAYAEIRDTIRLAAPFFDDFRFVVRERGLDQKLRLEWKQRGTDYPFQPWHLSDGTIRFICLATALLQPELPSTLIIDEPELGLHPQALSVLAGLIRKASKRTQVIVSTQSVTLLNEFEPQDVVVVTRKNGASHFERLDPSSLASWLDEYSLGTLWEKNFIEAGATHE